MSNEIKVNRKGKLKTTSIVEFIGEPENTYISLNPYQKIEGECIVSINQKVKKGELIAKGDGINSFNIFSSVSGNVKMIKKQSNTTNDVTTYVAIKNDKLNDEKTYSSINLLDNKKILNRLEFAGIFDKINNHMSVAQIIKKYKDLKLLIINGCDTSRYTKCSSTAIRDYYSEIFKVAKLICQNNESINIVITYNSVDASVITNLFELVELNNNRRIIIKPVSIKKFSLIKLVKKVVNIKVLSQKTIEDCGVTFLDATTVLDIYKAIFEGIVPTDILVTIGGKAIVKTGEFFIPNGTTIEDITKQAGGFLYNYDDIEAFKINAMEALNDEIEIKKQIKEENDKYQKSALIEILKEKKKEAREKIFSKLRIQHKNYLNCLGKICILNNGNLYEVFSDKEIVSNETFSVLYFSNIELSDRREKYE